MFARIVNISDPSLFSLIYGRDADLTQFDKYVNQTEHFAKSQRRKGPSAFAKGDPVVARCSAIGGRWADGVVGDSFRPSQWEVAFRLFSSTEVLGGSDMVPGPSGLSGGKRKKMAARLLNCSLDGTECDVGFLTRGESPGWSEECLAYFRGLVEGRTLKVASMDMRNESIYVNLIVEDDRGEEKSLRDLMLERGHLEVGRTLSSKESKDFSARLPLMLDFWKKSGRNLSEWEEPTGADLEEAPVGGALCGHGREQREPRERADEEGEEEDLDEICLMMKMTRDEYLALRESENRTYDLSSYPTIEELISSSLSIAQSCRMVGRHPGFGPVDRAGVYGGRGRGLFSFCSRWMPGDCHGVASNDNYTSINVYRGGARTNGHNEICRLYPLSDPEKTPKLKEDPEHFSDSDLDKRLDEILLKNSSHTDRLFDVMETIGIGGGMICTLEEERRVSRCLRLLLERCAEREVYRKLCVDFVGQITARSKNAIEIWSGPFLSAFESIAGGLDRGRMQNFSSFMGDVYVSSKSWLDRKMRELITDSLFACLDKTIEKIDRLGKGSTLVEEALVGFATNFLSVVSDRKNSGRRRWAEEEETFLLRTKLLVESKNLPRHISNLLMTFLDVTVVCSKYAPRTSNGNSNVICPAGDSHPGRHDSDRPSEWRRVSVKPFHPGGTVNHRLSEGCLPRPGESRYSEGFRLRVPSDGPHHDSEWRRVSVKPFHPGRKMYHQRSEGCLPRPGETRWTRDEPGRQGQNCRGQNRHRLSLKRVQRSDEQFMPQ